MTQWRVINRLRAIAEHGGLEASPDRRATTHNVRQGWLARFWFVPYNTGWHLAHHVDMGVPWRNLPRYHAELERAGYVTDGDHLPELPRPVAGAGLRLTCRRPAGTPVRRSAAQAGRAPHRPVGPHQGGRRAVLVRQVRRVRPSRAPGRAGRP